MTPRRAVLAAAAVTTIALPTTGLRSSSTAGAPGPAATTAPAIVVAALPPATMAGAPTTANLAVGISADRHDAENPTTTTVDLGPAIAYATGLWHSTSTTRPARVVNGAGRAGTGDWCVRTEGGRTYTAPAAFLAAIDAHLGGDRQTWCRIGWREGRWQLDPPGNRSFACTFQVWYRWVAKAGLTMAATRASYDTCAWVAALALREQGMGAWAATR